ncbi:DUF3293 domain-containing protein [Vibrio atypicus]|uniref:DUF3293 domain-containing protein n=1 Tax=Vibrio atypicus TaxID=558271 RepID=UPI003735C6D9
MMIDAQLWASYLDPYFRFGAPIRCDSFAIITAWNPASKWQSNQQNGRNNQQLRLEIDHTYFIEVLVGNQEFSWAEESFATAMTRHQAVELGVKYGQNAIYFVEKDQLFLLSCLEDKSVVLIGDWRCRCK